METLIYNIFINNWQRKLVALIVALLVWFFVNYSITATKTIPGVPIRIINLPVDKTIQGLLPNGILSKRVALTLSGSKDVINELEPGDLQVLVDASTFDRDDWVLILTKKNLVSLSPDIDLAHSITNVAHTEFILKMSRLVTEKIPITILPPTGEAPAGYQFLDIWPQKLTQTISGPEDAVLSLKTRGLELAFDLSEISRSELEVIRSPHLNEQNDEISFYVPGNWKEVAIPFHNNALEEINDTEAQYLRIDFLRQEILPLEKELPVHVFFPLKYNKELNPDKYKVAIGDKIENKNGVPVLNQKLYAKHVSRLFTEIIKPYLELVVVAAPKTEREILEWDVEVIATRDLEDDYVSYFMGDLKDNNYNQGSPMPSHLQEAMLRKRFRHYLEEMQLYSSPDQPLDVDCFLDGDFIKIKS